MKLKKIASLMLAGVMAISMLTACGDKGSSSSSENNGNTSTASYTDTILAETKAATKLVLSTSSNDKLDKAVEYAAKNYYGKTVSSNSLEYIASTGDYNKLASTVMAATDVVYTTAADGLAASTNGLNKDGTVYALYKVSRMVDDEYIENALVDLVDKLAADLYEDTDDTNYEYTIRIAKADSLAGKDADRTKDVVVIGVAITVDQTKVTY